MNENTVKISLIPHKNLELYTRFVRSYDIPVILRGAADVFGIDTMSDEPIGAAVVEPGPEPDSGPGQVLVIKNLYITEKYRERDVINRLIDEVCEEAAKKGMPGIVLQIAYPDFPLLETIASERFSRLDDGNIIYELDVDYAYDHPAFKMSATGLVGSVRRVCDLSVDEQVSFISEWNNHFPKGLSYERLPGKWMKDLSFVYQSDRGYAGYILSSELSKEKLYVGAVYSDPGQKFVPAALIAALGRAVILDTDYRKVIFAAASDEGRRFCDKLLSGMYSMKKWEIHNYYMEV